MANPNPTVLKGNGIRESRREHESCVVLDGAKFVKTGYELSGAAPAATKWPLSRLPMRFETSISGVFAVGDVHCGAVKRVAGAVGEGATTIQRVHQFLAETNG